LIVGVNHAQVNVPRASLEEARAFYIGFLGLREISRPAVFRSEGFWTNAGAFELHIGVEEGHHRLTSRAHLAYEVTGIGAWREKVVGAGLKIVEQPKIPGYERFHFRDPFGNNIELIEKVGE
jgi:catechol 2,3-dioxygenase-like lactoylglutathione lyase family enzyme